MPHQNSWETFSFKINQRDIIQSWAGENNPIDTFGPYKLMIGLLLMFRFNNINQQPQVIGADNFQHSVQHLRQKRIGSNMVWLTRKHQTNRLCFPAYQCLGHSIGHIP